MPKVLSALAGLSKELLEPYPANWMEAAFAIEARLLCVCFQGGYRDVGTMAIWPDPFWSRLQLLRGLPGRGLDLTNATDCSSKSVDFLVTTQTSMCMSTWTDHLVSCRTPPQQMGMDCFLS